MSRKVLKKCGIIRTFFYLVWKIWDHLGIPGQFWKCLENWKWSGIIWTVLKLSEKLKTIWKKNYSFETVWKFEITWKKLDSFETVPKTPNNLEISEYFVSFGIIWNTFELPEFFQIINRLFCCTRKHFPGAQKLAMLLCYLGFCASGIRIRQPGLDKNDNDDNDSH